MVWLAGLSTAVSWRMAFNQVVCLIPREYHCTIDMKDWDWIFHVFYFGLTWAMTETAALKLLLAQTLWGGMDGGKEVLTSWRRINTVEDLNGWTAGNKLQDLPCCLACLHYISQGEQSFVNWWITCQTGHSSGIFSNVYWQDVLCCMSCVVHEKCLTDLAWQLWGSLFY